MTSKLPSTLAEWLDYIETQHPKSIEMGLERVAQVARTMRLNPSFPIVTVAGTNGKGSVCALLSTMLTGAGFKVGCYTSPHLVDYNERISINLQPVSDAALLNAFAQIEKARGQTLLTYFEYGTLAALSCLIEAKVEVAILEVGLGGRLDAVNIVDADCAVITTIDLDHQDYLGDTREQIGLEKAGILRAGRPAICGDANPPESVVNYAKKIGATWWQLDQDFGVRRQAQHWHYWSKLTQYDALPIPVLRGEYQLNNASVCLAVLDQLHDKLPVDRDAIQRGLLEVEWPARFQVLPGRPVVILDVAHNPQAARALADNLGKMGEFEHTFAVFAMLKDKDIARVVKAVEPQIDHWLVAGIDEARGMGSEAMAKIVKEHVTTPVTPYAQIGKAYAAACEQAEERDRIVVFGSFYTVAGMLGKFGECCMTTALGRME